MTCDVPECNGRVVIILDGKGYCRRHWPSSVSTEAPAQQGAP